MPGTVRSAEDGKNSVDLLFCLLNVKELLLVAAGTVTGSAWVGCSFVRGVQILSVHFGQSLLVPARPDQWQF